ncbi:MAG: hypothetical protein SVM80_07425 [Halobacteriota archaeon]|nr:hypothetical protein [Halobacteriota archaeon]
MIGNSTIVVKRAKQYVDGARKYRIILDNKELGVISRGEIKDFEIRPGMHEVFLKIDWCRSNKLQFNIQENQRIKFICGCSIKGWKYLIGFMYALFLINRYLYIELDHTN